MLSSADSHIDTLSTLLSGLPSILNIKDLNPALMRSTELGNAKQAQELHNNLLSYYENLFPSEDDLKLKKYKIFLSHAKIIFFKALCEGLTPETPEFSDYLNVSFRNHRQLVDFLKANDLDI